MQGGYNDTLIKHACSVVTALILCFATFSSASAQDGGVRYTLSPVGGYLFESENAALDGALFYGGELGLGFGQYLRVSGEVLLRNNVGTDFTDLDELVGFPEPSTNLRRYGGRLRVNFTSGELIPFLSVGTGVLEFDTDGVGTSRSIYAVPGVGLGFEPVEGVRASIEGELLSYRYDPASVFLGEDAEVAVDEQTAYTPSLRASVELLLGGRSLGNPTPVDRAVQQQFGDGLRGMQVFVAPFYGRMEFNDALGFPRDQNLAGVNAGVDLGPFVGLRGFYWRGTPGTGVFDEFPTEFESIQLFGGELRLHLSPRDRAGITPYVLLGGGYLDVRSGYSEDIPGGAVQPEDRFFATAGGGLNVPLTSWLALTGDVRSVFMSGQDVEDISTPDEVYGNLMYTVGFEFSMGGGSEATAVSAERAPVVPDTVAAVPDTAATDHPTTARDEELRTRVDSLQRQLDEQQRALEQQREMIERDTTGRASRALPEDSLVTPQEVQRLVREEVDQLVREEVDQFVQEEVRAQMQQLEVDTVRIDTTRQLTRDEVERIARRTLREEDVTPDRDTAATTQQREEMQRLEDQVEALQQQVDDLLQQARPQPPAQEDEAQGTQVVVEDQRDQQPRDQQPFYRSMLGRPLQGVLPSFGVRGGEGPTHMLIGLRGDYRLQPASQFRLLPEAFVGFGDGPASVGLFGNIGYGLLGGGMQRATDLPLGPYIGAGAGLISPTGLDLEFVGQLMIGVDYLLDNGNAFFVELGAFNLFDFFRFGTGYRFRL